MALRPFRSRWGRSDKGAPKLSSSVNLNISWSATSDGKRDAVLAEPIHKLDPDPIRTFISGQLCSKLTLTLSIGLLIFNTRKISKFNLIIAGEIYKVRVIPRFNKSSTLSLGDFVTKKRVKLFSVYTLDRFLKYENK